MSRRGWALFLAMSLIWGTPYLMIRVAVRDLDPGVLVFARTAPAALLLLPAAWRRGLFRPLAGRWRWILAYTLVELALPWLCLSSAEVHLPSSLSSLLVATVPLVAAVLGVATGSAERLGVRRLAGLALGLGGVVVLVGIDLHGAHPWSLAEVAVVAVGYAAGPLIISRRLSDLPGISVVWASLVLTAVAYAPWALTHRPRHVSGEVGLSVLGLAVLCTAVAFVLFFRLIAEVGPARATVITYINPAVALVLGVVGLDEAFTAGLAIGFPLVLAGSVLATARSTARPGAGLAIEPTAVPG